MTTILTKEEYTEEFGSDRGYGLYLSRKTKEPEPVYNAYGLVKVKGGYKVHTMTMLGKKVQTHSYTEIEPKNFALNKMLGMIRKDINEDS